MISKNKCAITALVGSIALASMVYSCSGASRYSGDGHLVDNGASAATDRYVLDLGEISLVRQQARTYHMTNLPTVDFVVGLDIRLAPNQTASKDSQAINPEVSIELLGPRGEPVFRDRSLLRAWTWSVRSGEDGAFVYKRDQPSSFFSPARDTKYELKFEVIQPDSSGLNYTARLLAKSGGWK